MRSQDAPAAAAVWGGRQSVRRALCQQALQRGADVAVPREHQSAAAVLCGSVNCSCRIRAGVCTRQYCCLTSEACMQSQGRTSRASSRRQRQRTAQTDDHLGGCSSPGGAAVHIAAQLCAVVHLAQLHRRRTGSGLRAQCSGLRAPSSMVSGRRRRAGHHCQHSTCRHPRQATLAGQLSCALEQLAHLWRKVSVLSSPARRDGLGSQHPAADTAARKQLGADGPHLV